MEPPVEEVMRAKREIKEAYDIRHSADNRGQTVLIYPSASSKDAVTLTNADLDRLTTQEFLNDSLVDYELKRIQERLEKDDPAMLARCHFFNSFFYKRLLESLGKRVHDPSKVRENFERVERWTKNIDLFSKDFIFVPINEALHWSLAIICKPGAYLPEELRQTVSSAPGPTPASHLPSSSGATHELATVETLVAAAERGGAALDPSLCARVFALAGRVAALQHDSVVQAPKRQRLSQASSGRGAGAGAVVKQEEAVPPMPHGAVVREEEEDKDEVQPCILYLDSLGGHKPRAMKLLQVYMHEEWWAQKRRRAAAAASSSASVGPQGDGVVMNSERLFADLPAYDVKVREQHNGCDSGLYMLRYIELVSKLAPPLWSVAVGGASRRWAAHEEGAPEMKINSFHIDQKRKDMHEEIKTSGAAQKAAKEEEKEKAELQKVLELSKQVK